MDDTNGLIVATVVVTGVTTMVRQVSEGKLAFRPFLADAFMGVFLTGIGMVNAKLARNFCLLIMLATLLRNGDKFFAFTEQATGALQTKGDKRHG